MSDRVRVVWKGGPETEGSTGEVPPEIGEITARPVFRELARFETDALTGQPEDLGELMLDSDLRSFHEAWVPAEGDLLQRFLSVVRGRGATEIEVQHPTIHRRSESPAGCGPPAPPCAPDSKYAKPLPQPALGDLTDFQGYLKPTDGVNAQAAWRWQGGRGEGIVVADLESGWFFHHGLWNRIGFVGGLGNDQPDDMAHGTAVLGVIGARRHGRRKVGLEGVANEARLIAIPAGEGSEKGAANAILNAISSRRVPPGSVLLIETQHNIELVCEDGRRISSPFLPLEATGDGFTMIRRAVDLGYHVVQAAANGSTDVGPFLNGRDSGAILVGGGFHLDGRRVYKSNFGERVNVSSWGSAVASCGAPHSTFGDLWTGRLESYTASFNSTSSAAAIVAGVVACVLGILMAHGVHLAPRELRDYLVRTGNPRMSCPGQHIGPQPDLGKLIAALVQDGVLPSELRSRT